MTDLLKPVTRRTSVLHKNRRIIVTLRPDNQIEFRLEGTQQRCKADIALLHRTAQHVDSGVHIPSRETEAEGVLREAKQLVRGVNGGLDEKTVKRVAAKVAKVLKAA